MNPPLFKCGSRKRCACVRAYYATFSRDSASPTTSIPLLIFTMLSHGGGTATGEAKEALLLLLQQPLELIVS